jgi:hypothetical protein
VWLTLWSVLTLIVVFVNWVVTLIRGRSPDALHRFLAAYVRYETHVVAFLTLVANPFPGFVGAAGSYPVDVQVEPPDDQNRAEVGFRFLMAIPAFIISSALNSALWVAAFLGWFASLFTGRMPNGLRRLGLFALRYNAQTAAYGYALLTERYPYAGPPADAMPAGSSEPEMWPSLDPPRSEAAESSEPAGFAPDDPRAAWVASPFAPEPRG